MLTDVACSRLEHGAEVVTCRTKAEEEEEVALGNGFVWRKGKMDFVHGR